MNINMLFYSHRCNDCRNLLLLLKNENLINYFKLICVDDKLNQFPPNMIVPTMIINNINNPLVGYQTFEWINQIKFIRQQQPKQNNFLDVNTKGPIGYDDELMSGISDKFAFTHIDKPLPHSYYDVNDQNKNIIFTAPEQYKISKKDQISQIKNLEHRRQQQNAENLEIIKQQQQDILMKNKM